MAAERLAPDAILSLTGGSGSVTSIDEDPDSPDANWVLVTNNNTDLDLRVSFPSPSGNLASGADLQNFRWQVRKNSTSGTGTPTTRAELWENGALVRAGGENNVTSTTGQVFQFLFNATELANANGSLVECRVYSTRSGGSPSVRAAVDVGAVEWNADVAQSFSGTGAVAVAPSAFSSSGVQAFSGTTSLAGAPPALDSSGSVNITYSGTGALLVPLDFSSSAALKFLGDTSFSPNALALTAAGATGSTIVGTGDAALAALGFSALGTEVFTGGQALNVAPLVLDGTAEEKFLGGVVVDAQPLGIDASGAEVFDGNGDFTLASPALDAVGEETFTGGSALSLGTLALALEGLQSFVGASSLDVATLNLSSTGLETFAGAASLAVAAVSLDGGNLQVVSGNAAVALAVPSPTIDATLSFAGTGMLSLAPVASSANGIESITGNAVLTVPFEVNASGIEVLTGGGTVSLPALVLDVTGEGVFGGAGSLLLPSVSVTSNGTEDFWAGVSAVAIRSLGISASGAYIPPTITGTVSFTVPITVVGDSGQADFYGEASVAIRTVQIYSHLAGHGASTKVTIKDNHHNLSVVRMGSANKVVIKKNG